VRVKLPDCKVDIKNFQAQHLKPYLARIPADPKQSDTDRERDTRYYINDEGYGIITVGACDAESQARGGRGAPELIEITR
jgi:hypothetical protein